MRRPDLPGWLRRGPPAPLAAPDSGPAIEDDPLSLFHAEEFPDTVLVTLFGVDPNRIPEVLERARAALPDADKLVFVTDQPDFIAFRRLRVAFEYLPPAGLRSWPSDQRQWSAYLGGRYRLLLAKWRPRRIVSYGQSIEAFIGGNDLAGSALSNPGQVG